MAAMCAVALEACATGDTWLRLRRPASPHEQYLDVLERTGQADAPLGREWIEAATTALVNPMEITLPHRQTVTAGVAAPSAAGYRIDVPEGRRLSLDLVRQGSTPGRVFLDLFVRDEDGDPRRLASLTPDTTTLTHDVGRDVSVVVRVQPELLWSGTYVLTLRTLASLPFPVQGLTPRAVQSRFGAERDAGRRAHEGIDIFAPRGTPVVAVAGGIAQPSTNGLGGTVVWLHQPGAGRTFYYAHLDRWAFDDTRIVAEGDVLGYVGNTGNARTTAPHLHFGIYDDGARDPLPYVAADDPIPPIAPVRGRSAAPTTR